MVRLTVTRGSEKVSVAPPSGSWAAEADLDKWVDARRARDFKVLGPGLFFCLRAKPFWKHSYVLCRVYFPSRFQLL